MHVIQNYTLKKNVVKFFAAGDGVASFLYSPTITAPSYLPLSLFSLFLVPTYAT
jgi:hypothetical protein